MTTLTPEREAILVDALATYGPENQRWMLIEEVGELLSALGKLRRGRVDATAVIDEIADAQVLLWQMARMHGIEDVEAAIDMKLARLRGRLEESRSRARGLRVAP